MDKSLLLSALKAASLNEKEQATNTKRGYIRRLGQFVLLILSFTLGRAGFRYSPSLTYARAERRFGAARAMEFMNGVQNDVMEIGSLPRTSQKFISFDLGGSGLKAMQFIVSDSEDDGLETKQVAPVGDEVNLGRIPLNSNPNEWLKEALRDKFSLKEWTEADYGFSGPKNTFKLFDKQENEAIKILVQSGNLESVCKDIVEDVPSWAQDTTVWCKEWYNADEVLGLTDDFGPRQHYLGSFGDGNAHFEGARASLELMELPVTSDKPFVFVSLALGTGESLYALVSLCILSDLDSHLLLAHRSNNRMDNWT